MFGRYHSWRGDINASGNPEDLQHLVSELIRLMSIGAREADVPWEFVREGRSHEIWSLGGRLVPIPRHREINDETALAVLRTLEERLGKRWWRQ